MLSARCHYSSDYGLSVEEINANMGGTMNFLGYDLGELFDGEDGFLLQLELLQKLNEKISEEKRGFTEEEFSCFLEEGFLGVLKMREPEIQQNQLFNFYYKVNKTIEELEEKFQGRPYSEVLQEIQNHLDNKDDEDYKTWMAIHLNYDKNFNWVRNKETGDGGRREEYVEYLGMISKETEKHRQQQYIDSQINAMLDEWGCKSLREFFDSNCLDGLKDINDLMKFCKEIAKGEEYKLSSDGSPLDAVMDLYSRIGKYFENEHTAEEIGGAVKDTVTQKSMQDVLANFTESGKEPEEKEDIDQ